MLLESPWDVNRCPALNGGTRLRHGGRSGGIGPMVYFGFGDGKALLFSMTVVIAAKTDRTGPAPFIDPLLTDGDDSICRK
jgi:hypothetical protein